MAYQDKQQAQNAKQDHKARPEEQFVPDQRSFGMPNSLMRAAPMVPPPGTPNSVMREMDPEDNSGVLFRSRGFDPSLGVHELSHTVRRESVSAPVRLSAPAGTIQRNPTGSPDMAEYAKKQIILFKLAVYNARNRVDSCTDKTHFIISFQVRTDKLAQI